MNQGGTIMRNLAIAAGVGLPALALTWLVTYFVLAPFIFSH